MDTTEAYRATRGRICALAGGADGDRAVPACPRWTVRDLLAHLTGVADDILQGRLDGVATDAWTRAQVARRADASVAAVVAEWQELGPALDELMGAVGGAAGQLVFDTVTHEHDLRGALGMGGDRHDSSIAMALAWATDAWRTASSGGPGPLRLVAGDVDVVAGEGVPVATVELDPFEATRALTGRRSPDQLAAYTWTGDATAFLPRFTWGPFTPRPDPLVE